MNHRNEMSRIALALLVPFALAACDDDGTGVEAMGQVSAELRDGSGSSAVQGMTAADQGPDAAAEGSFTGEASADARIEIFSETEGWIELGSPNEVTIDMQAEGTTTVHGSTSVPAGSYSRARLVIENGSAVVDAGADLGTIVLSASVTMTIGGTDGSVTIEKNVTPFTVSAESSTTVGFDLNSETWVTESNADAGAAADAEVQSAATFYVGS